ncbi:MAG TPA: peptidoglycan DD-metalloendopeptidase family protein [Symbiobacteriaceae bacterium]|nr:peptidoglycan DD-metalloendopeptidase family protein [Symbiobacteriaceae bacterium]
MNFPAAMLRRALYTTIALLVMGGLAYNVKQLPSEAAASPDVTRINKAQPVAAMVTKAEVLLAPVTEGPAIPARPKITEYTVAEGDNLEAIAGRFGLKVDTLVLSNGMESNDDTLSVGQKLVVPAVDALVYKIAEGDNFWTVADQFGTTEEEIVKANPDIDPQAIQVGAMVVVPGGDFDHVRPLLASRAAGSRRASPAQTHKLVEYPVGGIVTDYFGWRIHPVYGTRHYHDGTDFNAEIGTPVAAAADGTVIMAEYYGGYGRAVKVDHGGGVVTMYAHLSSYAVDVGQKVSAGQVIAYSGNTGTSTGPHLHFTVIVDGTPVDPLDWLP